MATDIQTLVYRRWQDVIETPLGVPLFTSEAASGLTLPYAVANYPIDSTPLGAGRWMALATATITVYDTDERRLADTFEAVGWGTTTPTGLHQCDIGDTSIKATSQIQSASNPTLEIDPPLGGGRCWSRTLTVLVRSAFKG
jgi:hypothetical protein